jgi:N-acetylmuramoyl-L-alanine amidase
MKEPMEHSRVERMTKIRQSRKRRVARVVALASAGLAVCAVVFVSIVGLPRLSELVYGNRSAQNDSSKAAALSASLGSAESAPATYLAYTEGASVDSTLVEVPDVVGRTISEASTILRAAGLTPDAPTGLVSTSRVTDQQPRTGEIVQSGALIRLVSGTLGGLNFTGDERPVVCIDPGHQSRSNNQQEPVGPGATQTKPKSTGGATGVVTHVPESEVALQIAMNVKARLEATGIKVVMTRTTNDVDISNAERAQISNRASADLFVRIHANGSGDARAAGVSLLYPAATGYTKRISANSKRAALAVQSSVLSATGASSRGMYARSDLAGFNWCKSPALLIECGFLSNPVEDRLLTSPAYQDELSLGIARGIVAYFGK